MDYDQDNDSRGLSKGPFYGASAFIFVVLALFASVALKEEGMLGPWQIATCLLGTGLIAVLLFLPHFLEGITEQLEESFNQQDSDLPGKALFELKEMRTELDALALKLDKIPTIVNKIVSDSLLSDSEPNSSGIIERLNQLENDLRSRLDRIEETATNPPPLLEPDPSLDNLSRDVKSIHEHINSLSKKLASFPPLSEKEHWTEEAESPGSDQSESEKNVWPEPEPPENLAEKTEYEEEPLPREAESFSEEVPEIPVGNEAQEDVNEGTILEDESLDNDPPKDAIELGEDKDSITHKSEIPEDSVSSPAENHQPIEQEQNPEQVPEELALGLPDPQETLRKVDALLAGEEVAPKTGKEDNPKDKIDKNGTTTVVANVMIGIGNKPYLRGEGPGLSWDEGVSMNFIEIGKWAWSPPRKNASLTVQVYRNDQDPDKSGKVEVKPGQKLEITPDFS
ncbi:MAG: hypothetical protein VW576_05625 [Opitutae bacterium]